MGRPEDEANYTVYRAEGITVFVEHRVLKGYLEDGKITFHLDQYGRFELILCEN
jgi:hypothetical protein